MNPGTQRIRLIGRYTKGMTDRDVATYLNVPYAALLLRIWQGTFPIPASWPSKNHPFALKDVQAYAVRKGIHEPHR